MNHRGTENTEEYNISSYNINNANKGDNSLDISGKDCRDVPWNVSTEVSCHAYLIFGEFNQ
jgi:hypothetical protein